jgi:hypothetical protein
MDIVVTPPTSARRSHRQRTAYLLIGGILSVLLLAFLTIWCATFLPGYLAYRSYQPQEGDVLFQSLPESRLVRAIEGATRSPFSHCGVVAKEDGRWVVYEAFKPVGPVPLRTFTARGRNEAFAVYRLKSAHQKHVPAMLDQVRSYRGRLYDERYRLDDNAEAIYCSELIYLGYRAASGEPLGKLVTLGQLNWKPYSELIERIEQAPPPTDREIITPRDLAAAEQLERVYAYGFGD